jgi:hypothetical protein
MKYKYLIAAGRAHLANYPGYEPAKGLTTMFPTGARWMYDRLAELDKSNIRPWDPAINYNLYGFLKYGICVAGFLLSCVGLAVYAPLLVPVSILVFYLFEIQFLFLFPLLIDHSEKPVIMGIRAVFTIGIIHCLFTVIPIGCYMLAGLLHKRQRYRNWYIGCMAILIWYNDEVRNRL